MIYIYTLSNPTTKEVRYVGKTINIKRRYKQHLYDKRIKHKYSWVQSLKNEGLKPLLTVIEVCDQTNWQEREKFWITQFDNLINFLDGGGTNYTKPTSEETKEKIRQANLGKKKSEDHKNKLRNSANKKSITIDGIIYDSLTDASKRLNIRVQTIYNRVQSVNFPNYTKN